MKQEILTIRENVPVTGSVYRMRLEGAELEAQKPGGFVNIRLDGLFLRRPISVFDSAPGSLTILYKVVGKGTEQMSGMKAGETLDVLTGLGNGYDLAKAGDHPLLLGGGVGVPPLYLLAKQLIAAGKKVSAVLGFNTAAEVFGEAEFRALGCDVTVTTADGSYGVKGFVTDALPAEYSYFYTCGPEPMLKAVYRAAKRWAAASAPAWAAAARPSPDTSVSAGKARCWRRRKFFGTTDSEPVWFGTGQPGDPRQRYFRLRV